MKQLLYPPTPIKLVSVGSNSPNKIGCQHWHYKCAKCNKPVPTHEAWHSDVTDLQYHHKCLPKG